MKHAKIVACLPLVLVILLPAGCKGNDGPGQEEGDGIVTVGLKLDTTIADYDTNGLTKYLEEVTGLNIEFEFFSSNVDNAKRQLTLMCAGQEKLPDVLLGINLGHYMINQFGEDGYFIDLAELIETNAPNFKAAMSKLSEKEQKYIREKLINTSDGKSIFAMPSYCLPVVDDMQSMMYINKTWLDKVGMSAPANVEELEKVLTAFATKDPNGNGVADEIPMLAQGSAIDWIINAFVQYSTTTFNVTGGKVWDPVYTDEFRKGVQFVSELVKKGLCHEYGFTLSTQEVKNLISPTDGSAMRIGIFAGHPESMTNLQTDALDHYVALGALADATGKGGYNMINDPLVSFDAVITSDCKDPKEAMKLLDAFYTDECVTRQRFGVKGEDWEYEEGENIFGSASYCKVLNPNAFFDGSLNATLHNLLGIKTYWNYAPLRADASNTTNNRTIQASRILGESWNVMQNSGKKREYCLDGLIYTADEYDVRELYAGKSIAYMQENATLFMQGLKDPYDDVLWQEFLTNLTSTKRDLVMNVAQSAYDRIEK